MPISQLTWQWMRTPEPFRRTEWWVLVSIFSLSPAFPRPSLPTDSSPPPSLLPTTPLLLGKRCLNAHRLDLDRRYLVVGAEQTAPDVRPCGRYSQSLGLCPSDGGGGASRVDVKRVGRAWAGPTSLLRCGRRRAKVCSSKRSTGRGPYRLAERVDNERAHLSFSHWVAQRYASKICSSTQTTSVNDQSSRRCTDC